MVLNLMNSWNVVLFVYTAVVQIPTQYEEKLTKGASRTGLLTGHRHLRRHVQLLAMESTNSSRKYKDNETTMEECSDT